MVENNVKIQGKCALCGKPLGKAREGGEGKIGNIITIDEIIIDGQKYLFDTKDCATIFKRFGVVYGSNFYSDMCEISEK
jgi:hypothetical protein